MQEYERAVIFRLGRLLPGGAKGPGIFQINNATCQNGLFSHFSGGVRMILLGVAGFEPLTRL